MSALRQSSHTGVKRFRALFMTSNPCIRKDPGAEEHGVVKATVSMWMAEPQGRAYFLCSLASGSVTHGRHACLLLFPRGFSGCSSEVLFLRPSLLLRARLGSQRYTGPLRGGDLQTPPRYPEPGFVYSDPPAPPATPDSHARLSSVNSRRQIISPAAEV